jgi:hypothetical protein
VIVRPGNFRAIASSRVITPASIRVAGAARRGAPHGRASIETLVMALLRGLPLQSTSAKRSASTPPRSSETTAPSQGAAAGALPAFGLSSALGEALPRFGDGLFSRAARLGFAVLPEAFAGFAAILSVLSVFACAFATVVFFAAFPLALAVCFACLAASDASLLGAAAAPSFEPSASAVPDMTSGPSEAAASASARVIALGRDRCVMRAPCHEARRPHKCPTLFLASVW